MSLITPDMPVLPMYLPFPGRWQVPSNSAAISSRLTSTISGYLATPPEAMCSTRLLYGMSTS